MRRLAVLVLGAALILTACSGGGGVDDPTTSGSPAGPSSSGIAPGDPSAPDASARPPRATSPPRPKAGACYRLTYDDALAPTVDTAPVRCRRGHTAVTFHVGTLDTVVDGHLVAVDAARVRTQAATVCPRRLPRYLGADTVQMRLTVLRAVWFSPSLAQSDEGQDWFRCDVIAPTGDTIGTLATPPRGALATAAGRTAYGVCGTAEPGTRGFRLVACSQPHRWRAVADYELAGKVYPGRARVRQVAADRCRDVGKSRAEDPLNYRWGFDYPSKGQWRSGTRYGLCWVPD